MTRQLLEQVYYLRKEYDAIKEEIATLEQSSMMSSPSAQTNESSFGGGFHSKTEDYAIKIAEHKGSLAELERDIAKNIEMIDDYLKAIDDSLLRQIVYYRCECLLGWNEVAKKIGAGYTDEAVRQIYHRSIPKN